MLLGHSFRCLAHGVSDRHLTVNDWLRVAVKCEKTLIGEFGCRDCGLGKARCQNLVVDVMTAYDEVLVLGWVEGEPWIMLPPVSHKLGQQIGIRNAKDARTRCTHRKAIRTKLSGEAADCCYSLEGKSADVVGRFA